MMFPLNGLLNVPKRGIGDTSFETIRNEAKAANLSEYNYMLSISPNNSDLSPRVITALTVLLGQDGSGQTKAQGQL
jgi:superfamily I DNA/RNA helicase